MVSNLRALFRTKFPHLAVALGRPRHLVRQALAPIVLDDFHFDIMSGCQLRCVGCPNSTLLPNIQQISTEIFARCLANVNVNHVKRFAFFNFGEPLLHRDLASLVAVIPQQRWTTDIVEISTNAQKIDWARLEEAIKLKVITHFAISCDGDGTPGDFERLRPPAKWTKLVECFEKISELRDRVHPELKVFTRTIIRTRSDRLRWEATLKPFGIEPEFRGWMNLPEASTTPKTEQSSTNCGICHWMSDAYNLYVTAAGDVVPCCLHPRAGILGSLLKDKYTTIRRGDARRDFRYQLKHNRSAMKICSRCEAGPNGVPGFELSPEIRS